MFLGYLNSDGRRFELRRNIIVTIIAFFALIMVGCPAMAAPGPPNLVINFEVTNPNFTITSELAGTGGENSTDATVEFGLVGAGQTYGTFEGRTDSQTRWTSLYGRFYGSEGNFTSTFSAQGFRTNSSDLSSTFFTTQGIDATGVGQLYVYGEVGACSVTDTWALGFYQEFNTTAQSVTVLAEHKFEQRDGGGSVVGNPVNNQFTVTGEGGSSFIGSGEGGSYDNSALPGFGTAANSFYLEDGSGSINTNIMMYTDQIVGGTSTWCDYPGYPNP